MLTAEELHRRAVEAVNHGRVRPAGRLLERAAERSSDPDLLGRIEVSRAYVAMELGDLETATRLCHESLARPGLARPDRGVALAQLAMLHMRSGQTTEALASFTEAIALLDTLPVDRARALGNRGDVFLHQRRVAVAVDDFRAAAEGFSAVGLEVERAKAEHNLGYALMVGGDLIGALEAMSAAYPVLAPVSPVHRAVCTQDRAEVLLAMGLEDEGAELLRRAARDYGLRGLRQRQGEAELALARGLVVGDPTAARRLASSARSRFARLGHDAWRARADALVVAADVGLDRHSAALVQRAAELAQQMRDQGLGAEAAATRLNRIRALIRRGALDDALAELSGLGRMDRQPLVVRLQDRDARAELAERTGRRTAGLRQLRAGLDDLHAWQSSFGSLDLQTNVVGHGVRLAVRGLALAVGSPSDAVLFEWSERARMLASRIQPVRAPQDPQAVADLAELRAGPAPEREAELRRRIREQAWQRKGSGEFDDPVSLASLQNGLDAGTALVAYVVTATRVVALVVTDRGTARHDLGDRAALDDVLGGLLPDLDMAAADLPEPLAGSVRGALARRLDAVAALLVAPLLPDLGDRRVVLTPSGVLAGVPWTLLPGLVGRSVTVAQSATSWLVRCATPLRTGSAGFVAGPRVVRAEAEVRAGAAAWPGAPVLTGPAATAAAVSELAGRVDVVHLAAHGRHSAENPLFSGLELVDGPWFGYDIDQLPAVPDVVLLSACEVGRSSVRWGEELIGMTAAWLHAGARRVVASPAAVNDVAAHDTLVRVHTALADGTDPATALAATITSVTSDAAPAPFVCFG
ncbi:CHAT domain-containing tetratricopeptide repeat protein [uncultured Nocardioides sp.]|uniref:CHAT domain-containing protein n=1 Tax=uncultured Nocardioides sp. TaxID=198441 RepID=UPI0026295552|nr:CHAT domain-containing tetratricopeptide repeat protein [uncultured Nocardioides sp.]